MFKSLMLMGAAALAAPALAQSAATPQTTNAAQPEAAATPAAPATPSAAATPSASATPAPAANPSDAVAAVIATDWAKYDKDNNGNLSKEEFGAWMGALREQNPAQKAQVTDVTAWTTAAFAMADKDKDGSVTRPELEGFLKG